MPNLINDKVKDLALQVNDMIKESVEYKEYQAFVIALKDNLKNEDNLVLSEGNLKLLQQELVNQTYLDSEDLQALKDKYQLDKASFLENDFVKAYKNAYEAYSELIFQVKEQLEGLV